MGDHSPKCGNIPMHTTNSIRVYIQERLSMQQAYSWHCGVSHPQVQEIKLLLYKF